MKKTFIALLLSAATLLVYVQTLSFDFVNYDDPVFVTENDIVKKGLAWDGIKEIILNRDYLGMHLSFLSHAADVQVFGLNAGYHHLTNLILHLMSVLLLMLFLARTTGALLPSTLVAALFAIHPLNVESVAWVAERRNVLSTVFFLLTLLAYQRYSQGKRTIDYLAMTVAFAAGLMAKTMLVTLPFLLLLLDLWPLKRIRINFQSSTSNATTIPPAKARYRKNGSWVENHSTHDETPTDQESSIGNAYLFIKNNTHLFAEKIPLFILSALGCVITLMSAENTGESHGIGGLIGFELLPMTTRIGNAIIAYAKYIVMVFWPTDLTIHYDYLIPVPRLALVLSTAMLLALFWISVRNLRKHPWFAVGWLWYFGTLVPVIGIIQIGGRAMADRYAYLPTIGIFIIIAWCVSELAQKFPGRKKGLFTIVCLIVCVLGGKAWLQTRIWQNSLTLFQHAVKTSGGFIVGHNNLGLALKDAGDLDAAIANFRKAIRLDPSYYPALNNLGLAMSDKGDLEEAVRLLRNALKLNPKYYKAHLNLATVLKESGRTSDALSHFYEAARLAPNAHQVHHQLGFALGDMGDIDSAIDHLNEAIRIKPDFFQARNDLGNILKKEGNIAEAIRQFELALEIKPDDSTICNNMGLAKKELGRIDEAAFYFNKALALNPDSADAHNNLGTVFRESGKIDQAIQHYSDAIRLKPNDVDLLNNLGLALNDAGQPAMAIGCFQKALVINPRSARTHINLGNVLKRIGKSAEAANHYRNALSIDPASATAHNNLGDLLSQQGDTEKALYHYRQTLAVDPGQAVAYYNMGVIYIKKGLIDEAQANFTHALERAPTFFEARIRLADTYEKQDRIELAIDHYQRASQQNPQHAGLHYRIGILLMRTGKYAEAERRFHEALRLAPNFTAARAALQKIATHNNP